MQTGIIFIMALGKRLVVVVLVLVLASGSLGLAEGSCNFAATCAAEGLTGTTLSASCAMISGASKSASIELNSKIANQNGQLLCNKGGGNFAASCSSIGLNGGYTLYANCKNIAGTLISTSVNLNDCISNQNGVLTWC